MTTVTAPMRMQFRHGQLTLICIAVLAGIFARSAIGPVQESIRQGMDFVDAQMAVLQGPAIAAATVVGAVPIGLLIDRISRARLMLAVLLVMVVGTFLTAAATGFGTLLLSRMMVGLVSAAPLLIAVSLIADRYGMTERGRAIGILGIADVAGSSAAFAAGGFLLANAPDGSWRFAVGCMAGILMVATVAMLGLREAPRHETKVERPPLAALLPELWAFRRFALPLMVARMLVGVADAAAVVWAVPLLARTFKMAPDKTGAIMATVLLIAGLTSALLGGLVADHCQRRGGPRLTASALALLALAMLPAGLFALGATPLITTLLLGSFLSLGFTVSVAAMALATVLIPNEIRGLYLSISQAAGLMVALGLSPMAVTGLSQVMPGPFALNQALATVCAVAAVMGASAFAVTRQSLLRDAT